MRKKIYNNLRFVVATVVMILVCTVGSVSANAAEETSGSCGENVTWHLSEDKKTLYIEGSGEMTSKPYYSDDSEIKESIEAVEIDDGITKLYYYLFENYVSLSTVTIPKSVSSIGLGLFDGCTNLSEVVFEEGCAIKEIPYATFSGCKKLNKVTIPDSVEAIGDSAFSGSGISNINFPSSVTSIGYRTFGKCSNLKSVTIPSTVTTFSVELFHESGLETIVLEPDVVYEADVLGECHSLKAITFKAGEVSLEGFGRSKYESLEKITIGKKVSAFSTISSLGGHYVEGMSIKEVVFEEGGLLTAIPNYTFKNCINLTKIEIPKNVTKIGESAFDGCTALNEVIFYEGLQYIDHYAFLNCPNLRTATIPKSVTYIGSHAFNGAADYSHEIGKFEYDYTTYAEPFIMKGYYDTEAEEYASRSYNHVTFQPLGGDISNFHVYLTQGSFVYDGTEKRPGVKLQSSYSNEYITEGFKVEYRNNVNIGTATVIITGTGNLTGTITKTFTIKDPNEKNNTSTPSDDQKALKEKAIMILYNQGYDPRDIMEARSEEEAYEYAERYLRVLMECDKDFIDMTTEDLIALLMSSTHTHNYTYTSNKDATVLKDGTKTGSCSCGDKVIVADKGSKLKATIKVPAKSFALKTKQVYKG